MLTYINHEEYDKNVNVTNGEISYFSKKKMKKNYPKASYIVVGAIGHGLSEQMGTLQHKEEKIDYYTLHFNHLWAVIDGYIDCGNEQFIAITKPARLRNGLCSLLFMAAFITLITLPFTSDKLDPNAKSYTPNIENSVVTDDNHIALPGYDDIRIEAGSKIAYLALWNPDGNPCLFKFTLLKDGNELYQSGMIEPGKAVTEVTLKEAIPKGVHDAVLKIQTFALDNSEVELNGGEVLIKLVGLEKEE